MGSGRGEDPSWLQLSLGCSSLRICLRLADCIILSCEDVRKKSLSDLILFVPSGPSPLPLFSIGKLESCRYERKQVKPQAQGLHGQEPLSLP